MSPISSSICSSTHAEHVTTLEFGDEAHQFSHSLLDAGYFEINPVEKNETLTIALTAGCQALHQCCQLIQLLLHR